MAYDERTVLDAANRHIAKLNERIATLEADNNATIARELSATERMRHWRCRALKLAYDLAMLRQAQTTSPVKSSPVPAESSLPEPEKPSQDAVWRNATRFSR